MKVREVRGGHAEEEVLPLQTAVQTAERNGLHGKKLEKVFKRARKA